ncbi:unnamed protein product [Microthlaspi erraticum]|uniref:Uncharacterized protein n=1 Tax=Microthlaspi erraticum TaxID=1685480 RepID=A0A6D2K3G4_9BRAS|nr:unnamed protein product [Microthlaspi erraticum]
MSSPLASPCEDGVPAPPASPPPPLVPAGFEEPTSQAINQRWLGFWNPYTILQRGYMRRPSRYSFANPPPWHHHLARPQYPR